MNSYELYDSYTEKLQACDIEIEQQMAQFQLRIDTDNRANHAFRLAAATLGRSQSVLGVFYRRMKAKLGTPKAVVTTGHKLAHIVYHLLNYQVPFSALLPEQEDARYRQRALRNLQRKAHKLGARLVVAPTPDSSSQELVS